MMRGDFTGFCGKPGSGAPRDRGRAFVTNGVQVICAALVVLIFLLLPASASGEGDTLVLVGSYTGLYYSRSVSAFNQHAFMGNWIHGLYVMDYSDPSNPESVAVHPGYGFDVEIEDGLAYCGGNDFYVKDAASPEDTGLVGSCCLIGGPNFKVHVFGSLALVLYYGSLHEIHLELIDVSEPSSPLFLSAVEAVPYGSIWWGDAYKKDDLVYWVDEAYLEATDEFVGRILVFDIGDPINPVPILVDTCLQAPGHAIWIEGDYAYVGEDYGGRGLMVFDVSDPYSIDSVGCFAIPEGRAWNVHVRGRYAYVCAHPDRVYVLDISDPSTPTLVASYDTPDQPRDIFVDEPYVLVRQNTSLSILEASFLQPLPGDTNKDGVVDIGDAIFVLNYLFKGGPRPFPSQVGDVNGDDTVDVGDVIYLLNYLFRGGSAPHSGSSK